MTLTFKAPVAPVGDAVHHDAAATSNIAATGSAIQALSEVLEDSADYKKVFLRAAAGAGKSYSLVRMVREALEHEKCSRIAVTAFANKQVFPLAEKLGSELGADRVCLFVAAERRHDVPSSALSVVTVAVKTGEIPTGAAVVLGTSHKLGAWGEAGRLMDHLGPAANGDHVFDVLMVDEAWQLPLHRYTAVEGLAPISVGVGDVGQLPPIDPGANPWRGDPGYNPYRAWPTAFNDQATTFSVDMPAVWRPHPAQLGLWRAFYGDWERLDCVAAPGDRSMTLPALKGNAASVWSSVASGVPTLLEVDGLEDADAPDIDLPLLGIVTELLEPLLAGGFVIHDRRFDGTGHPQDRQNVKSVKPRGDPLIVLLATRNQAVDDATEVVEHLAAKHSLPARVLEASTVDSWQGQTNRITIALHPLSGASRLDDFNSAFGRLAVTCTRATHGLLVLARTGLDDLLENAPARSGTPFGEPGTRTLPRQTHHRILDTFARGVLHA
jgi:hypothetical protein